MDCLLRQSMHFLNKYYRITVLFSLGVPPQIPAAVAKDSFLRLPLHRMLLSPQKKIIRDTTHLPSRRSTHITVAAQLGNLTPLPFVMLISSYIFFKSNTSTQLHKINIFYQKDAIKSCKKQSLQIMRIPLFMYHLNFKAMPGLR